MAFVDITQRSGENICSQMKRIPIEKEVWLENIHIAINKMKVHSSNMNKYTFLSMSLREFPYGLVVRIRRSHRRGPGSIPGVGIEFFLPFASLPPPFFVCVSFRFSLFVYVIFSFLHTCNKNVHKPMNIFSPESRAKRMLSSGGMSPISKQSSKHFENSFL